MKQFTYVITDPLGIHARPAGKIVKEASQFLCEITLQTPTAKANAKGILSVMKLVAKQGTPLTVTCVGEDEDIAAGHLEEFLKENL